MSYFTRLSEGVETGPLMAELDADPDLWFADTSRQRKIRCQRNTLNIFLRAPRKPLPPGAKNANDVHESRLTRVAAKFPSTLAFCEGVAAASGATLGRAALVSLQPGSRVYPHIDVGDYYRIRDRLHLVLRSPGGSPLTAEDKTVVMREGELWVFNNKVRHSANNPSGEARVHLIFDVLPPPGLGCYAYPPDDADDAANALRLVA